jgi:hypothetical protein
MYTIISDSKKVKELTGVNVDNELITSNLFRDCFGGRKSMIVNTPEGKNYLIADDLDKCDWDYRAKNLDGIFYYYTYLFYEGPKGKKPDNIFATFEDAIKACAGNNKLTLPGDIGVDFYERIKTVCEIENDFSEVEDKKFYVYSRDKVDILKQIHEGDNEINKKSLSLMNDERSREILKPYINNRKDSRFSMLDEILKENGLTSCVFSSPLNVQEISALPYSEVYKKETYAYYNIRDSKVYIVSSEPLENMKEIFVSENFKDAFRDMDLSSTGVGEGNFMAARLGQLGLENPQFLSDIYRTWREERSGEDLPYYIIVAKATVYAIEGACKYALESNRNYVEFTEADVYAEYTRLKIEFMKDNEIGCELEIYDPCTYASTRSVYPGVASDYVIPVDAYTMRLDNGEFIKDKYGYIHAVSDIARTVCFNEPSRITHEILLDILEEKIIPNIKVGMKFSDIWNMGVDYMADQQDRMKELGMIPPEADFKTLYKRNIGHGISKQTRTANFITEHNDYVLKDNTVGNIELPINFRRHIIAVEDMWFATDKGTINITKG